MDKAYDAKKVEDKIYQTWEQSGFFNPDKLPGTRKEPFTITMPPPNATGTLHAGHAMMLAIEDLMVRYQRMKGKKVLWLPGTDHAAIATQTKVEKILLKEEGKTRHDLGRKKFVQRVEEFVADSRETIRKQIRKMGSSCDWSREKYTLDKDLELAVRTQFKNMYDDGLIYRGNRIVNWCPRCHSTLADDEVEYQEQTAKLYYFKYDKNFPITIATTRPETKLGDTAVAVNPKDKRYVKFVGKEFDIDLDGTKRKIKIIADKKIDQKFGTGALGVTPAHSHIDYEMAQKNKLEIIKVIDEDGKMTVEAGLKYKGLTVQEAREKLVRWLDKQDLLEMTKEIQNNLSICYRCDHAIEPLTSKQWFIDVNKRFKIKNSKINTIRSDQKVTLKELMQTVVKEKQIDILPERFNKTYFHWVDNLRDWCISRQIWFGHQMPVWYKIKKSKNQKIKTTITYFVHGTSVDNEKKLASGHNATVLSDRGKRESEELKEEIRDQNFDVVFCSDLKRAVQSAEIVFGKGKFKIDKRLREVDYGKLTGRKISQVYPLKSEVINAPFPGGESYKDVEDRMREFLSEVMDKYAGKKIAIVAHQAPQLALDILLKDKTWPQAFAEDWRRKGKWRPGWSYTLEKLIYVGIEPPKGKGWIQDEDTLDTWFSSGLWTFSTLGWPEKQKNKKNDLETYHPTSVMETGYDIIFFWVARMILMSTYALGEIPFETVYLHGLVRDEQGRKMSKSLGNVIDPLDVIAKYGTDALRLSYLIGIAPGQDLKLYDEKFVGARNFVNKLWNISRYILENSKFKIQNSNQIQNPKFKELSLADKWILSRLNQTIEEISDNLEKLDFSAAGERLRSFTWDELADWYLEISKIEKNKDQILIYLLENVLKLWHPFTPFVTEEIWSKLGRNDLLMIQAWPEVDKKFLDQPAEKDFVLVQGLITAIRNLRTENKVEPGKKVRVVIKVGKNKKLIDSQTEVIKALARLSELELLVKGKVEQAATSVVGGMEVYLFLEGLIDFDKEREKFNKEKKELEKYRDSLKKKLANKGFVSQAPQNVVAGEKAKLAVAEAKIKKLQQQIDNLK